eukprot:TRINITY_DN7062_c0_g1_i4.p1 TRINITY_DN7062_c0_g1~~TRINITY_DN7062_c0_g1_i4.p1  ORF type:complete len:308 (-),score=41.57 TRINITY_DN7062_c0_g1_i4:392-1315(-)
MHFKSPHSQRYLAKCLKACELPLLARFRNIDAVGGQLIFQLTSSMVILEEEQTSTNMISLLCDEVVLDGPLFEFSSVHPEIILQDTPKTVDPTYHETVEDIPNCIQGPETEGNSHTLLESHTRFVVTSHGKNFIKATHPDVQHTTISSIVNHQEHVNMYVCKASVISIHPSNPERLIRAVCPACQKSTELNRDTDYTSHLTCPSCGKDELFKLTYMFQLKLKDDTGCLKLLVHGDHGSHFFAGYSEREVVSNSTLQNKIKVMTDMLLKAGPQIFCIMSYKHAVLDERRYQLFNTEILVDAVDLDLPS